MFYTISSATSAVASAQVNWLVTDQLGTPRMIIDQTGTLANVKRHDYLPFGEELTATQGRAPRRSATAVRMAFGRSSLQKNGMLKPDWITQ